MTDNCSFVYRFYQSNSKGIREMVINMKDVSVFNGCSISNYKLLAAQHHTSCFYNFYFYFYSYYLLHRL
jgi:hypothetical protein